jgi:hypothetical protein
MESVCGFEILPSAHAAIMNSPQKNVSWLHRLAALVAVGAFASVVLGTLIASQLALPGSNAADRLTKFSWAMLSGGVQHEAA